MYVQYITLRLSLALLYAADAKAISVDAKLCGRFMRAVGKIYLDAPARFWYLLRSDVKLSLKSIFERGVWGADVMFLRDGYDETVSSKGMLLMSASSNAAGIEDSLALDSPPSDPFADSDTFLSLLLQMDSNSNL